MQYWMHNSGSAEHSYTKDDWKTERGPLWPTVNVPLSKRPTATRGDRMLWHAIGSAQSFGTPRFFALGEVISEEPHISENDRWPWALNVDILIEVPLLSLAPSLDDIGVNPRSLNRQQYIRIS